MSTRNCSTAVVLTGAFAIVGWAQPPRELNLPGNAPPIVITAPGAKKSAPAKPDAQPAPNLTVVKFDPRDTSVRMVDRRWQLWSGKQMLKDFGGNHAHALEARRLVAELQLTEHASLGAPESVMEYWLSNGQPPPITAATRTAVPIDAGSLAVESREGAYWLRDRTKLLYNFGPSRHDAVHGLRIMQQFGFNEVAYVGSPNPSMSYLVKNEQVRLAIGKLDPFNLQTLPQTLPRYPLQLFKVGTVGERQPFDPLKLEIRRAADGWHLASGVREVGTLGNSEHSARTALQVVQSYPFTEMCRVGNGSMTFYLSRGAAPRGVPLGVRRTGFNAQALTVKSAGDTHNIVDGNRVILQTNGTVEDAKTVIKVMQHYQFDCVCEVGQLRYFAKER